MWHLGLFRWECGGWVDWREQFNDTVSFEGDTQTPQSESYQDDDGWALATLLWARGGALPGVESLFRPLTRNDRGIKKGKSTGFRDRGSSCISPQ